MDYRKVTLDPGHGGKDPGASCYNSRLTEANFNLIIAQKVHENLKIMAHEYDIRITRGDNFLDLVERCHQANEWQQGLPNKDFGIFVSIHFNSSENKNARGYEVIYSPGSVSGEILARNISNQLSSRIGTLTLNRGVKTDVQIGRAGLAVLKHTKMPAVIVECLFLSNPEDAEIAQNPVHQWSIARAIAVGISNYFMFIAERLERK